jgi:hypothetical protein
METLPKKAETEPKQIESEFGSRVFEKHRPVMEPHG